LARPFSTEVLHASVFASSASCRPQKSQVFTDQLCELRSHVSGRVRSRAGGAAIDTARRARASGASTETPGTTRRSYPVLLAPAIRVSLQRAA
jgi:hypothetical protein